MQDIYLEIRNFERGWSRSLKKWTLFFLSSPDPFNRQKYQKQKGPRTNDQLFFRLRNKFRKIPLSVMCYLTRFDDVISSRFYVIPKFESTNSCTPIHDALNYSTSICPFESGNWGKITEICISPEQKELFRWIKKHFFIVFEGLSIAGLGMMHFHPRKLRKRTLRRAMKSPP